MTIKEFNETMICSGTNVRCTKDPDQLWYSIMAIDYAAMTITYGNWLDANQQFTDHYAFLEFKS